MVIRCREPVIEITDNVNVFFLRSMQLQNNSCVVDVIDAILKTRVGRVYWNNQRIDCDVSRVDDLCCAVICNKFKQVCPCLSCS